MTLVSVIIPAFNGAATLRMPMESIRRQTYRDIEFIIIDDGSTDDTPRVAEELLRDLPFPGRVVSHQRNLGLSFARNTGLNEARGEWIQFLDADDYIAPTKISNQMAAATMAEPSVASVYSPFQTFALDGEVRETLDAYRFPDVEQALPVAFMLPRGFVHLSATLTRRSAMLRVGGFKQEAVPWEDDEIKVRMVLAGYRFVRVPAPDPAFFWRLYPEQQRWGGTSARYRMERVANRFLSAVTLALKGAPPDEAALPLDLLGELDEQLTSQVRLMFRHDRQMGDEFLAKVLAYYPRFRPTGPSFSRRISTVVGVRRFEHAVANVRSIQRAIRAGGTG
ncbi:MAG: glycosyltransferase family 2 protein [Rhodospirillales bacterium]|nr:glycosyltransferase family 2 protein [Rhodospirillales bacterium]